MGTLTASALLLAGPGGLAGCGAVDAKKSADAAAANLSAAKVVAFTMSLKDPKGSLLATATTAEDKRVAQFIESSSLTVTIDPAGDATFGSATKAPQAAPKDLVAALKNSGAMRLDLTRSGKSVVGLTIVNGVIYTRVDLAELSTVSGQQLSEQLADAPPMLAPVVDGLKTGKWLSLDLPALLAKYPELAKMASAGAGGAATPSPQAMLGLQSKLLAAFEANSTKTVTASGDQTEVRLTVKAKAFLTAVVDTMAATGAVPGTASSLSDLKSGLSSLPDGTVDVILTIKADHYTSAVFDLQSLAKLSKDPKAVSYTAGEQLRVDINDQAAAVTAPAAGQVVDLNSLVQSVLSQLAASGRPLSSLAGGGA
ncbi:MAG TPA: hypothetical protein VFP72_11775 [Kineosporiaceae bacterium]|nr:hypothetical protein [Kineosporiaceae bacterium]